jgi:DNA-binding HxlR family transcriptional regulator
MKPTFSEWPCTMARTMEVFGDSWSILIVRDASFGLTRFDDFHKSLGIARNTLSDRLNRLVDHQVMVKQLYQDNPPRNEYLLTEKGREFYIVLESLRAWGARWTGDGEVEHTFHHETCGHELETRTVCASCGEDVRLEDTQMRDAPGFPKNLAPGPVGSVPASSSSR